MKEENITVSELAHRWHPGILHRRKRSRLQSTALVTLGPWWAFSSITTLYVSHDSKAACSEKKLDLSVTYKYEKNSYPRLYASPTRGPIETAFQYMVVDDLQVMWSYSSTLKAWTSNARGDAFLSPISEVDWALGILQ